MVWSGQVRIRGFDNDYDCYDYYDYYDYDYYDYDYCDYDYYDYNYYSLLFFLLLISSLLFLISSYEYDYDYYDYDDYANKKSSPSFRMGARAETFDEFELLCIRIR